jgi:NAD(P)-dependent dehydrogenase (short-subunit alcohol dehydrogenase family)
MQNSYTNKIVLVTGGTSGIGKTTAIAFADAGARVVLTGRREKEGLEVVAEIKKTGGTAAYIRTDVAKEADVVKAVDFVLSTHGPSRRRVQQCRCRNRGSAGSSHRRTISTNL